MHEGHTGLIPGRDRCRSGVWNGSGLSPGPFAGRSKLLFDAERNAKRTESNQPKYPIPGMGLA